MEDIRQQIEEKLADIKQHIDMGRIDAETVDDMIEEILG